MPWVKIGRYRFDLDDVALVADVVGDQGEGDGGKGVTVTLQTQLAFDLLGRDAEVFTKAFDEHVASREIGRAPPPGVRGGRLSFPPSAIGSAVPAEADR